MNVKLRDCSREKRVFKGFQFPSDTNLLYLKHVRGKRLFEASNQLKGIDFVSYTGTTNEKGFFKLI